MTKTRIAAAFAAVLCVSAASLEARELRVSNAAPAATPWGKALDAFAARVAELSGGKLTLKTFPGGQLGDEQETIRQTVRGRIDITGASNTAASLIVPEFALLAAPYLWDTQAQGDCVTDKHLMTVYEPMFDDKGLRPISWTEIGNQILFTTSPVSVPADIAGKKIRTAPVRTDTIFINSTGATAVPLGLADSMPALKTGGVVGVTFPAVYGLAVGYQKVASNILVTNHSHQTGGYFVSAKTWKSLSDEEKGWITDAAATTLSGLRPQIRKAEAGLLQKAATEGATVHEISGAQAKAWRLQAAKVTEQVVEETGGNAKAVWAKIQSAKQDCGS
ncbi:MAG: TRAP transporter substrate-binding protein DctP [Burkholderiaceae bacterium]